MKIFVSISYIGYSISDIHNEDSKIFNGSFSELTYNGNISGWIVMGYMYIFDGYLWAQGGTEHLNSSNKTA